MLDVFAGSGPEAAVYQALVGVPRATEQQLAERLELSADEIAAALERLVATGFAMSVAGTWEVVPPEAVAAELQAETRQVAARIEAGARALEDVYRAARLGVPGMPPVDVLHDAEEVHAVWFRLQLESAEEICNLERPPYLTAKESDRPHLMRQLEVQADRMDAGVVYRTVYERTVLDDEIYGRLVVDNIAMGNRARTLDDIPVKLAVFDRRRALLQLDVRGSDYSRGVLLVHPSGLLDVLVSTFETLWRLAVPINAMDGEGEPLDQLDRDILSLMAVGATDDLIARRLDVSRRTVVRHTGALLERLGASNRFQAGLQAARRGWL